MPCMYESDCEGGVRCSLDQQRHDDANQIQELWSLKVAQQKRITELEFRAGERCLNCGEKGPCEPDAEGLSACTFDKSPADMWVKIQEQQKRITEMADEWDAAANVIDGQIASDYSAKALRLCATKLRALAPEPEVTQ